MDDARSNPRLRTSRRRLAPVAMVVALGVLAFGCSKTAQNGNGTGDDSAPTVPLPAAIPEVVKTAAGSPHSGGKLIVGLEAETDGFDPTQNRWAASGYEEAAAFMDPLVVIDNNLDPKGFLVDHFKAIDGFYTWDMTLRQGIKFHDGTPFDANAVKKDLDQVVASPLTGAAVSAIQSFEITDPYNLRFHMKEAWSAFPYALSLQIGFMAAPKQLDDKVNGPSNPVGTGPFLFKSWSRDNKLEVEKNPNYWIKGLPYLDAAEFRPIVDTNSRIQSLQSGDLNMMITSSESAIKKLTDEANAGNMQLIHSKGNNDLSELLINVSKPPLNDIRVRQAMAYAIDRKTLQDITGTDPLLSADSVFQPDSKWYTAQPDYPKLDVEKAKSLVKSYEAEHGPISFTFSTTPDNQVLQLVQAIASMWSAVGIKADIQSVDQQTLVSNAVTGKYDVNIWRQFGAADPDINYQWFIGANADGVLALNMSRNKDPELDQDLRDGRKTIVFDDRKAAYDKMVARQTADLNYIWLSHSRWVMAASNNVRGIQGFQLPDGSQSLPLSQGVAPITGMWLES
jgi:ABC-type transport system substrate-binding protein